MAKANTVRIAVLPGDGIGQEVTAATLAVLEPLAKRHGIGLSNETLPAGAFHYRQTGEDLPEHTFRRAEAADAVLLGAMGWPGIRYGDGTEIAPQLDLRFRLGLYAGVRPVRAIPGVGSAHHYVDAMALDMLRRPWEFDVLPTENMFGDILSDLGAGLVGGMGFSPSADIGDAHAVFQPAHGTAPDIAGQGIANPTAMILSAAMMLDWLGARGAGQAWADASEELTRAVDAAFAAGLRTPDIGGRDGTAEATRAVIARIGG